MGQLQLYGERAVFLDDNELERPEDWRKTVSRELERRPWVVCCVGPEWSLSWAVLFEIGQVRERDLDVTIITPDDDVTGLPALPGSRAGP